MVASYNDYRRGDGTCYCGLQPRRRARTGPTPRPDVLHARRRRSARAREYWQAGGDTSVALDTKGNAYLSCQMFMRGQATTPNPDLSSAFFVFRSTGNDGASWNFPARPVVQPPTSTAATRLLDKQLMTVDNHVGSPFQDRVYVTWTTSTPTARRTSRRRWSNDYARALQRPGARQQRQRAVRQHVRRRRRRRAAATRTSSRSRSPAPTARSTSCSRTSTTSSRATTTATRCCSPSRPTVAVRSVRRSRSATTTTCPTAHLPGAARIPGGACVPEKGPTAHRSSGRRTTRRAPSTRRTRRRSSSHTARTSTRHSNEIERLRAGRLRRDDGINTVHRREDAGRVQQQDPAQRVERTAARRSPAVRSADPRTQTTVNARRRRRADQFWQWAAFNKDGKLAVSYYDRQYGNDETTGSLGLQPVRLEGSGHVRRRSG